MVNTGADFIGEIRSLIETSRAAVAQDVNAAMTLLYWNIGKRIKTEILKDSRAEYGSQVVETLAAALSAEYGRGFSKRNLFNMVKFAEVFPDFEIVQTLSAQLPWSHLLIVLSIKEEIKRNFYIEMCRIERWSFRHFQNRIDSMLFERTAISKKTEDVIIAELNNLKETDRLTPDLVFRDPYFLDFLNLKDSYSEKDVESAIIRELESFILELGIGFTFVERQKRITIDGEDFYIDLLFFHRKLNRLVVIELKLGKFKAAYKGQMELYLRWLEKYEMQPAENPPIGLILCSEGKKEQIELLQLDNSGIRVAEYLTGLPPKHLLTQRLRDAVSLAREKLQMEGRK